MIIFKTEQYMYVFVESWVTSDVIVLRLSLAVNRQKSYFSLNINVFYLDLSHIGTFKISYLWVRIFTITWSNLLLEVSEWQFIFLIFFAPGERFYYSSLYREISTETKSINSTTKCEYSSTKIICKKIVRKCQMSLLDVKGKSNWSLS